MRIGYSVQGSTDRAFLRGLQQRWCPRAELLEGQFRGTTGVSLRREYRAICDAFGAKAVDVMVFLTDGDGNDWKTVQDNERASFPPERLPQAIHGVADRNIECWICSDARYIGGELGVEPSEFQIADPKGRFETALGIGGGDKKEAAIADIIVRAPLSAWLRSQSFADFYEQVRDKSQRAGCQVENLREKKTN